MPSRSGRWSRDADAARLFAADQDFAAAEHDVADILEAYAVLDQFAMVFAGDAVEHAGGVEGAGDGAGPLLALEKPLQQHRETLVRVDEAAVFGDRANAVGIAIDRQAGAAFFAHHGFLEGFHVRQNRLRIDAGKQRIHLSANLQVRNPGALEDAGQHSPPGAVHDVDGEAEAGLGDQAHIGEFLDGGDIGRFEIDLAHPSALASRGRGVEVALDFPHDLRRGRAAIGGFELHPVPIPRIVAGGDHDAAGRAHLLDRVRERRGRRVIVRQPHLETRVRKLFGRDFGEAARTEARIVGQQDAPGGVLMPVDVVGDGARDTAHIFKGEVVGDDGAPAIGAELDCRSHGVSYVSSVSFFSSRKATILPTSCARARVVTSSASSVTTTTRFFTPTAATNLPGACR